MKRTSWTEIHADHIIDDFVFSPLTLVVGSLGSVKGIKNYFDAKRNENLKAGPLSCATKSILHDVLLDRVGELIEEAKSPKSGRHQYR